jgi:leucyl aminopeptidase
MDISLSKGPAGKPAAAVATFSLREADRASLASKALGARLAAALRDGSVKGQADEVAVFREIDWNGHRHAILAGLGEADGLSPEAFRRAGAQVFGEARKLGAQTLDIDAAGLFEGAAAASRLRGLVEGLVLASYAFTELKGRPQEVRPPPKVSIRVARPSDPALRRALSESRTVAEAVNVSRRLGDLPANLLPPAAFASEVAKVFRGTGVRIEVWNKARLRRERMNALLAVAQGSAQEPRFVILRHRGGPASQRPLVFVGKGVTFDSGGISIKPAAAMEEMKFDKCGACNVAGALLAVARLKLPVNVVGLMALTENMPGPAAAKPGDVFRARNGVSFEINNTDAEGRLILADALSYASELRPRTIVDLATLTGAMVIALGNSATGFFTRDPALRGRLEAAAAATGERVWAMPLLDDHVRDMKGTFADLTNAAPTRNAGSATAAAFLGHFVAPGIPWAHCDIAGTAWAVGKRLPYSTEKGASGVLVRTLVELARSS